MTFLKRFIDYNKAQNLFQKNDRLLLAVSGGVDSVVLCELCKQANLPFEIAHCNFQLRGEESERDEKFARSLAKKYDVKIFVKKFNTKEYAAQNKVSIQVAARELRYRWFEELLTVSNQPKDRTSYLLTAHHANDNIETLLMNFFKGTGIKGLQGILPRQGNIVRPLLFAKKEEILQFAKENNLSFVEDSSNSSDKYTRNYFRNQLIPALQKVFPQVQENLLNNIERYREIEILYTQSVFLHKKKLLEIKGNEVHIPILKLLKAEPLKTIIYEIIKDYGFTAHQTKEVVSLLESGSGKYISSATHKIIRNRDWLIIAPVNTLEANHILINENDKEVDFEEGKLKIKNYELKVEKPPCSDFIATLDAENINFPLLLRKWKQGDYFYPLGMPHKKKLSKFFIDQKLSVSDKEKIWVIESNKKIIWIVGKRIDDRFKITPKTKSILEIRLS
jgi:tRNA(Ile)-lysidine synthase